MPRHGLRFSLLQPTLKEVFMKHRNVLSDMTNSGIISVYQFCENDSAKRAFLMDALLGIIKSWHANETKEFRDLKQLLLDSPSVIDSMMTALEPNRK